MRPIKREPPALENSVVKIFSTMRYPDPFKPWTKQAPSEATASGVVIEGKRILTNAHAVLYASQVQIQANAAGDKLSATVLAIAPGIDLAVLQLDDPSFFDTHPPVARASKLPQIKDPVLAYGFPTGGSSLSITKGIVSRIEFATYNYPVSGLRIQIDAAINPGNSGGPAIAGDKMIGLAFSRLGGDTQNIGYIIPNEEVDLFLKDIAERPLCRQGQHVRRPADAGKSGVARILEARQERRGHGGASARQTRRLVSLERVGRDHADRRYAHRQSGHGQDRQGTAREFRLHDPEGDARTASCR